MSQPTLRTMGRGTLSRRLVLRTTVLVAVIAIFLSSFTALAMHRILESQLDQQLMSTAARAEGPGGRGGPGPGGFGQTQGLLVYTQGEGGWVQVDKGSLATPSDAAPELDSLANSPRPSTVTLPELGRYRVYVRADADGDRVFVVGLPTTQLDASMASILAAAALLTVLAIAIAFLVARRVVERSLTPLARLAGAAHQVSTMDLDSGEVALGVRVPTADTDPRSEVGQVGLAFNHMLDNVEGALAARQRSETKVRQFVADASHELRNPLASIRGYAELTRRNRDDLPSDTGHALSRIDSESARMSSLVEDLLLLARLDAGPNVSRSRVDLTELVVNAVSDAQVAGPDHDWAVTVPDGPVLADVDRNRIHQVLVNLFANARTHTPPGTSVHTHLSVEGGDAVIRVADDGPGIPEAVRPTLFERFTRADTARVRTGTTSSTGLGLAIVAAVVAAHGGSVLAESGHVRGATFTVRLPRNR
ncbi:MAG: HAMP domain-containing histidine kinase [Propionibacteriaceae bacterium]|nr:HAMP domain-containing histidine kinase [Propionibacteriaceae bacterium]